jgi:hypothetical protein
MKPEVSNIIDTPKKNGKDNKSNVNGDSHKELFSKNPPLLLAGQNSIWGVIIRAVCTGVESCAVLKSAS